MEVCRDFDGDITRVVVGSPECSPEEETATTEGIYSSGSNSSVPAGGSSGLAGGLLVMCRHLGCDQKVKVQDLKPHMGLCDFRPVAICDQGCGLPILQRDLTAHQEDNSNADIPRGSLEHLDIMGNTKAKEVKVNTGYPGHDCITALKVHVNRQQTRISQMQNDSADMRSQFQQRERHLVAEISKLHGRLQVQALQFKHKIKECRYKITYLARKTTQHLIQVG